MARSVAAVVCVAAVLVALVCAAGASRELKQIINKYAATCLSGFHAFGFAVNYMQAIYTITGQDFQFAVQLMGVVRRLQQQCGWWRRNTLSNKQVRGVGLLLLVLNFRL